MKKLISFVIVFVLGFIACAFALYSLYGRPGSGGASIIERPSVRPSVPIASAGNATVADAAAIVGKAVVNIDTTSRPSDKGFPFDIFGLPFGGPQSPEPQQGKASGVIVRPDGYIVTNNHVVADAQSVTVTLHSGARYRGRVVGTDPKTDLAVVKIDARNLPYATFANADTLVVGDWVVAIGNALGLGPTVTVGVVSATQRALMVGDRPLEHAIQTDAAINRGNSGGALADLKGQVIGINTAIASTGPDGGSIGIGFAIPSNTVKKITDELIKRGKVVRPWLGIYYGPVTDSIRQGMGSQGPTPPAGGVIVSQVIPGSPAERAGIRSYDIILEVDRKKVTDPKTVENTIQSHKPGQKIVLLIWRNGQTIVVGVTLGEMPAGMG